MCGRFNLRTTSGEIAQLFLLDPVAVPELPERFNVAPTQPIPAIRTDAAGARSCDLLRWGLVPAWAKEASIGSRMINARGETVAEKPAFKQAFRRRRCLIPASGYYEWKKEGTAKQPYLIEPESAPLFAFAGLWELNTQLGEAPLETCTIITAAANEATLHLHDRMPVILPEESWDLWLDPDASDTPALRELLRPLNAPVRMRPVSTYVNNVRNEGPQCIEAL